MALAMAGQPVQARRYVGIVIGLVLVTVGVWFVIGVVRGTQAEQKVSSAYTYRISQNVSTGVTYNRSSFYQNGPGNNTAYVTDLTDKVKVAFQYQYSAPRAENLTYSYTVSSLVRGKYSQKGADEEGANVWHKEQQLAQSPAETKQTNSVVFNPTVEVPFGQYKAMLEQFRTSLSLPLTSEAVVTLKATVTGTIDGTQFRDERTSTVTLPLDQQIFQPVTKYDKTDSKQVLAASEKKGRDVMQRFEVIGGVAAILFGALCVIYGLRRQIFKSAYQRELDKIFRYHDGIIVRASKQAKLDTHQQVAVQSFDDLLNLEEELKTPIVAAPIGSDATQFIIMHGQVAYVYTLGKVLIDQDDELDDVEEVLAKRKTSPAPRPRRKI